MTAASSSLSLSGHAPFPYEGEMEAPRPDDASAASVAEEDEGIDAAVFVPYEPTIPICNAREHPADIAESASLS